MGDEARCTVDVDGAGDAVVAGLCAASEVWDGVFSAASILAAVSWDVVGRAGGCFNETRFVRK